MTSVANRYAVECDCTVINVDYRLSPETKQPGGVYDAYAALKWVIANEEKLSIDKNHIAIMGDSGGGYITGAVALVLADKDEGGLIKFQFPQIGMMSDDYLDNDLTGMSPAERLMGPGDAAFQKLWVGVDEIQSQRSNPMIILTKASAEQFSKLPKTVCLTTEFDQWKKATIKYAKLCEENGTLLELGILSGCSHGHFLFYELVTTDQWFAACGRVAQIYL